MLVEHSGDSLFTTSAGIDKEAEVKRIPYANKSNLGCKTSFWLLKFLFLRKLLFKNTMCTLNDFITIVILQNQLELITLYKHFFK